MKKHIAFALAILMAVCLVGCTGAETAGPAVYTVEEKVNAAVVNQWKKLFLLDDSNYVVTVLSVDPRDGETVTVDFYMAGKYLKNPDGTVTLQAGYGYAKMLHGDIPVEMAVQPDANGELSHVYYNLVGQFDTFVLNRDGTWTGA